MLRSLPAWIWCLQDGGRGREGRKVSSLGRGVLVTVRFDFTRSYHFLLPFPWMPATAWQVPMCLPQPQLTPGCGFAPTDPRSCGAPTSRGWQPFPSSGTLRAEAIAGEATGIRLLDTGKKVNQLWPMQAKTAPGALISRTMQTYGLLLPMGKILSF